MPEQAQTDGAVRKKICLIHIKISSRAEKCAITFFSVWRTLLFLDHLAFVNFCANIDIIITLPSDFIFCQTHTPLLLPLFSIFSLSKYCSEPINSWRLRLHIKCYFQLCLHAPLGLALWYALLQNITICGNTQHLCVGFHPYGNCNWSVSVFWTFFFKKQFCALQNMRYVVCGCAHVTNMLIKKNVTQNRKMCNREKDLINAVQVVSKCCQ